MRLVLPTVKNALLTHVFQIGGNCRAVVPEELTHYKGLELGTLVDEIFQLEIRILFVDQNEIEQVFRHCIRHRVQ